MLMDEILMLDTLQYHTLSLRWETEIKIVFLSIAKRCWNFILPNLLGLFCDEKYLYSCLSMYSLFDAKNVVKL